MLLSSLVWLFSYSDFFQIAVALFYHKYYINSKRLDAEKSFREKTRLRKNERALELLMICNDGLQNDFVAIKKLCEPFSF